jgi:hypothetical protein
MQVSQVDARSPTRKAQRRNPSSIISNAQLRLRAVDLANASADIKMGATNTTNLRQALANLMQYQ